MSTKEAQDRARKAHRERQKAEGWRQKVFIFAPETVARLARLAVAGKTSEAATVAHALAKLEESQQLVPVQVLDVDAEYRLPGPVKPVSRVTAGGSAPKPKPQAQKAKGVAGPVVPTPPTGGSSIQTPPVKIEVQIGPTPRRPGDLAKKGKAK